MYVQHADWIHVAANRFADNRDGDLHVAGNVTNLIEYPQNPDITRPPRATLEGPAMARVGQTVRLDAAASSDPGGQPLHFRWDLGDGTVAETPGVKSAPPMKLTTPTEPAIGTSMIQRAIATATPWTTARIVRPRT